MIVDGPIDVPMAWYAGLVIVYLVITILGSAILSLQFFTPVISAGKRRGIALSFDDGPFPGRTEKVLDVLREYDAPAAFFCIGNRMEKAPELLKRIDEEGHVIGNHSFSHSATFDLLSSSMVSKELYDTDAVCQAIVGKRPRFFRPPYGVTNPMIAKVVKRRNYKVIGWTVRSFDTVTTDQEKLLRRVTRSLKDGDIILFHDHCESTLAILPSVLEHVRRSGLKVVRLDELINERPYA